MAEPTTLPPPPPPAAPGSAARPTIEVNEAELDFGNGAGLFDLTFSLAPGKILGLIGPSGCGKTTAVRLMTGQYAPQQGQVRVFGIEPTLFSARDRRRIGYMPQHFVLYPNLTVRENIQFVAGLYGVGYIRRRRRLRELVDFVDLEAAVDRRASKLSGGMQRRVMLAATLMHDPTLLLFDEPTAGIDPILRERFWEHFRKLRDEGRTLVVTTQYVGEAANCDLVAVMRKGRLLHVLPPDELRRVALGGEAVILRVDPARAAEAEARLLRLDGVEGVRRLRGEVGAMRVDVRESASMLPTIFEALAVSPELELRSAEEYQPTFDEVFTQLIRQTGGGNDD